MKMWHVLVFGILVLFACCSVSAVQLNYQNAADFNDLTNCTITAGVGCEWNQSTVGANSNVKTFATGFGTVMAMYGTATPMTYAAGTLDGKAWIGGQNQIRLYDASKTPQYTFSNSDAFFGIGKRHEIVVSSGIASYYVDGIFQSSSTLLSQNPSYIGFGVSSALPAAGAIAWWDDLVYGSSEDTTVLDMPESGMYYIKKDFVNPASSGFYNSANTLINSNLMPMSFSRSNLSGQCRINESIYLINAQTGTVYETKYTGTQCSGQRNFDFGTSLVAANAPYGWYQTKLNNTVSTDRIAYIANGANINFNANSYSIGDTATITYLVDNAYWLPAEYTYSVKIVDAFGTVHNTQNVVTSSGSVTYTWLESDTQGVYYAEIFADKISSGEDILMNYDFATVSSLFGFDGFVNAAGNATAIPGASVIYAQGDIRSNLTSGFDGNYSTARSFVTGVAIWANASATGYQPQNFTFTVQNGHTIPRNITLNETVPVVTGLGIGGVVRDGIFTSPNTVTSGYGRPVAAASCYLKNTTFSEQYLTVSNNAGRYVFDETGGILLTKNRLYNLWCQSPGYLNSPNYSVVA